VERFSVEYADALMAYQKARMTLKKEKIGTVRPLLPWERAYYDFMEPRYSTLPTIRKKAHYFIQPPRTWIFRYEQFKPPVTFYNDMDALSTFAAKHCFREERNNWRKVLEHFNIGSPERFIWGLFFLKSTNGVADKVSCGHFLKVISNNPPPLSLAIYKNPEIIASIIRQTSKWVKNTVSFLTCAATTCCNIL
jgi:hypothetical protein